MGLAYGEDVFQCWLQEIPELLLRDEFEERWLERVEPDVAEELHRRCRHGEGEWETREPTRFSELLCPGSVTLD